MKKLLRRFDLSLALEVLGLVLVTYGLATYSIPIACISLGAFLVWATEKGA
jgi:hypothetical protein